MLNFARDLISRGDKIREIKSLAKFKFYIEGNSKFSGFANLNPSQNPGVSKFAKKSPREIKSLYSMVCDIFNYNFVFQAQLGATENNAVV